MMSSAASFRLPVHACLCISWCEFPCQCELLGQSGGAPATSMGTTHKMPQARRLISAPQQRTAVLASAPLCPHSALPDLFIRSLSIWHVRKSGAIHICFIISDLEHLFHPFTTTSTFFPMNYPFYTLHIFVLSSWSLLRRFESTLHEIA